MNKISTYLNFIKARGRILSEINPESNEIALIANDALSAITLLNELQVVILGGDILCDDSGKLIYAYQYWGSKYISLNWYCDRSLNESDLDYQNRSYNIAKEAINTAISVAMQLSKNCYVVIVI